MKKLLLLLAGLLIVGFSACSSNASMHAGGTGVEAHGAAHAHGGSSGGLGGSAGGSVSR